MAAFWIPDAGFELDGGFFDGVVVLAVPLDVIAAYAAFLPAQIARDGYGFVCAGDLFGGCGSHGFTL